jgi:oligosaccharide repeat unit polymerase
MLYVNSSRQGAMWRTVLAGPSIAMACPAPSVEPTLVLLIGLVLTEILARGQTASAFALAVAVGVGVSLASSLVLEAARSWTNLLRTDVVMLAGLYVLTFVEFLFPQPNLDQLVAGPEELAAGVRACLIGFAGLAIGRHFPGVRGRRWRVADAQVPRETLVVLFWISMFFGFLHMLLAVNFNPIALVHAFIGPRFTQPWQRGKYGDWKTLVTEIGALIYLVPPLAGIILSRARHYSTGARVLVLLALLFTMFYGLTSGTRSVTATFAVTFVIAFLFAERGVFTARVKLVAILAAVLIGATTYYSLQFRKIGLGNYLSGDRIQTAETRTSLFIDYNLYVISRLTSIFPSEHDYVGFSVPVWIVARPVPRAMWPGKPDGSELAAETYLGGKGVTLAMTFIGESYMAAGLLGVAIAALLLGALATWWTTRTYSGHSDFGMLIYSSGFFATVTTMRSVYWLFVAILPTVAAAMFGLWSLRPRPVHRPHPGAAAAHV